MSTPPEPERVAPTPPPPVLTCPRRKRRRLVSRSERLLIQARPTSDKQSARQSQPPSPPAALDDDPPPLPPPLDFTDLLTEATPHHVGEALKLPTFNLNKNKRKKEESKESELRVKKPRVKLDAASLNADNPFVAKRSAAAARVGEGSNKKRRVKGEIKWVVGLTETDAHRHQGEDEGPEVEPIATAEDVVETQWNGKKRKVEEDRRRVNCASQGGVEHGAVSPTDPILSARVVEVRPKRHGGVASEKAEVREWHLYADARG
ncbi:hypothetical protein HK104_009717 [Borealophlyctis nickersoniae]|nr:hypothetical protein HK104_009717 [Borealophlyctis nickersoniae]